MDADFLTLLRCPIDPRRDATLTRDRDKLTCDHCGVCFPIKNGLPVLIAGEADLGDRSADSLPCRKSGRM
ncbi:MAG: hypothetical protein U0871_22190 [Gemmataceae bacterium]